MAQSDKIQLFENKRIRTAWDEEKEEWYFSIVDVVAVLTDSPNPQTYWRVLKKRLKDEGNETVTSCNGLKMTAADGKRRMTDVADTEQLLRIIQSIPSPKAEPFKLWLAQVGRERIEETIDPELTIERALDIELLEKKKTASFTLTPKLWIEKTKATGIASKQGKGGGTFAHPMIGCEFASWISPEFKMLLLKLSLDRERLKA